MLEKDPESRLIAYADESFREHPTEGFYVFAAVVVALDVEEPARELLRGLRGTRGISKVHWNEMDRGEQKDAAQRVARVGGFHVVTVGSPVPQRRQERARAACIKALVPELHGFGVEEMLIEARAPVLNRRDVLTVQGARFALPKGNRFRVEHVLGSVEPLLWAADIAAGAVGANLQGERVHLELLDDRVYVLEVDTDC